MYGRGGRLIDLDSLEQEDGKERGILPKLIHRLKEKGLVPHDGAFQASITATNRTTVTNKEASLMDTLDRVFLIFKHPKGSGRPRDIYRRVDIVISCWASWGSAVVGWTGSTQFER
jgi:hypothetical protein